HVHGAERGAPEVRLVRRGTDPPDVLGCDVPAHRLLAERARLVDLLAHPAEGAQLPPTGDRGGPAVDLQVLEAVVAHAYAEGPLPVGGLEVGLPQVRRLEDVPVAVDYRRLGRHRVLSHGGLRLAGFQQGAQLGTRSRQQLGGGSQIDATGARVAGDQRSGADDAAGSDLHSLPHHGVGADDAVGLDRALAQDYTVRPEKAVILDLRVVTHDTSGLDDHVPSETREWLHHHALVNETVLAQ